MKIIWLTALIGCIICSGGSALSEEVIVRLQQAVHNWGDQTDYYFGNLTGPGTFPWADPVAALATQMFRVYTTTEIESKLSARDTAIETRRTENEALKQEVSKLRQDVNDRVTASLKALPAQLFTEETKKALVSEIVTGLQASLEARLETMKPQIESEIMAKIGQTGKTHPQ
jgi:hypothetical protein